MFGFFSENESKKLNKQYHALLKEAMEAQRCGNILLYSELSEKADIALKQIQSLETSDAAKQ